MRFNMAISFKRTSLITSWKIPTTATGHGQCRESKILVLPAGLHPSPAAAT
jgi:hypothetical protein